MFVAGQIAVYNWGSLVSRGSLWYPIPGVRRSCWLGVNSNGEYLSNSAVALVSLQPVVVPVKDIAATYEFDKPPLSIPVLTGPWHVTNVEDTWYAEWKYPGWQDIHDGQLNTGRNFDAICKSHIDNP